MRYFSIYSSEDGILIGEIKDIEKFLEDSNKENTVFLSEIPKDIDPNEWPRGVLLIEGKIVKPRPIEVVTKLILE